MDNTKKLQIVQISSVKRRIKSTIFKRISKFFDFEINRIKINELKSFEKEKVHLLIFDNIELKEISYATIDMIQNVNKHLHTIVCNEFSNDKSITRFYDNHIDYVIDNSWDDTLITSILKTILKRKSSKYQIERTLSFKNIELDKFLGEVKISNQLVDTTNKEFKIINYLLKNTEEFSPKSEIFTSIWGYKEDTTRVLSQYIHRIKKKIGNEVELIYEKGKGYKLV